MHIELVDALRCVELHEPSWLVATIDRQEGRYIASGSLGCPVCSARYPIRDFVADFRAVPARQAPGDASGTIHAAAGAPDDDALLRAAALLDIRTPGGPYLLTGTWGTMASALFAAYDAECLLVNPPDSVARCDGVSIVLVDARMPLAPACARGAAIDQAVAREPTLVADALRAVRPGGRVVAPAGLPLPPSVRELARDQRWWVAERAASPTEPVPLARAR
jgi:hypothetical protein